MKKRSTRLFALLLTLLVLCVGFASCNASSKNYAEDYDMEAPNEVNRSEVAGGLSDTEQSVTVPTDAERKIIKTYDISSETKDFDAAIASLNTLISECGGYVESSSSSNKSLNNSSDRYTRNASYTVRVPAENAEAFVGSVGTLFNITRSQSYVEDISETYYSITARLEELTAERDSLIGLLEQADARNDYELWTTITQRLSEVRQQIAVYQGQLNRYDSKVAYSTVNLSVSEVINYTAVGEDNSFGSRLGASFKEGWNNFGEGMQNFVIWLAGALPVLILLALIVIAAVSIIRAIRKRKKKQNIDGIK